MLDDKADKIKDLKAEIKKETATVGKLTEEINKLCKHNGFTSTNNRELYTMFYEPGQTNVVDSTKSFCCNEIRHI